MAIVPARCTQCGAGLNVDDNLDAAVCEYCHTPFIIEKAINQYNIESAEIHADVVQVNLTRDFEIIAGVLKEYRGAATDVIIPEEVVEIAPGAFSGMSGITSVYLPDTVKRIGNRETKPNLTNGAFHGCPNLKRVNIPDTVDFIMHCSFLTGSDDLDVDISIKKLMQLGSQEISFIFYKPVAKLLNERLRLEGQYLKDESNAQGICWSCGSPLEPTSSKKCTVCKAKL